MNAAVVATKESVEELSISKIASRCNLNRATTRTRLEKNGYKPIYADGGLSLYQFDAEMEARLTESNDELGAIKIRKETAAARKIELQVAEAEGELAPVAEFTDIVQQVFGAMHKEMAVRMPKRLAAKLIKAKSTGDVMKILTTDIEKTFSDLRDNYVQFLAKK